MGRRGPKPTPSELLRLRGSWRAGTRSDEVHPPAEMPKCPAWLDRLGRAKWRELAPELHALGLLTVIDGDALAGYCSCYAEAVAASKIIAKEGLTTPTEHGVKAHPTVAILRNARAQMRAFAALFGLNPADRSRVKPGPTPTEGQTDPFEELLGRADKSRFFERDAQ